MKKLITILILITAPLFGEVIIIHEKLTGSDQWVMGLTIVDNVAGVAAAVTGIDIDPKQRRGQKFAAFGGVRLKLVEVAEPDVEIWTEQPSTAILVFWNRTNEDGSASGDPADYFVATLPDQLAAEIFVNEILEDPLRGLWNAKPFKAQKNFFPTLKPGASSFKLEAE
jgi:hypothetical protein